MFCQNLSANFYWNNKLTFEKERLKYTGGVMKFLFKKEDFTLSKTRYSSHYEYVGKNFNVEIHEEDFSDEEIEFSNELINLYEENLPKIALACKESDTFKYCYPEEDIESIIAKLGKPIFRRMGSTTLLTYVEHEMDEEHLLDIEFEGFYDNIFDIGIDG